MSSPSDPNASGPNKSGPTATEPDPLLNRVIAGNFRIDRLLGAGAMGNVYKAEQISLGKAVAVKVLHAHLMGDEKLVMRFKREAKSASLLNHPNSIQIIDSGQDRDGTLYIAMELLAGRDLAHVIRDDFPLPVPRIVRIMSQVLSALDEAHAQGVIHRDLKPSNIMLIERRGERDFVKVCDFGIAKAAINEKDDRENMLTIQGLVCGTPEYMAPEQARGEVLDGRADLYAAAVILFQMVTGDIPFKGDTPMAIVSRHLVESPAVPSRRRNDVPIPPALDALILRGMEKNRELRFPNASAFREALEEIAPPDTGRSSSTANQRAQMPTTRISGPTGTAVVPSSDPANHFGVTTQMPRRSRRLPVALGFVLVLAGAAVLLMRAQKVEPFSDTSAPPGATEATMGTATPTPTGATAAAATAPTEIPHAAAAPTAAATSAAAAPAAAAPAAAAHEPELAPHAEEPAPAKPASVAATVAARAPAPSKAAAAKKHKSSEHTERAESHAPAETAAPAPSAAAAPAVAAAPAAPPAEEHAAPAQRGPREVLSEGEKLLGQGEVRDACARGEEAKRMNPKLAPPYKFLGKCYMREGNAKQANDNYRKYLELSPNASDAMFIKSIIK
jgi:serine/threonine-protein kinase